MLLGPKKKRNAPDSVKPGRCYERVRYTIYYYRSKTVHAARKMRNGTLIPLWRFVRIFRLSLQSHPTSSRLIISSSHTHTAAPSPLLSSHLVHVHPCSPTSGHDHADDDDDDDDDDEWGFYISSRLFHRGWYRGFCVHWCLVA